MLNRLKASLRLKPFESSDEGRDDVMISTTSSGTREVG